MTTDNRVWTKVYLDHDMADKISLLGGGDGDSHSHLRAGIQTALNMAVDSLRLQSPLDQQDDKEKYKSFLRDYQVWTRDTAIYKQQVTYPSLLLASEVGEALNIIQKVMRDDNSVVSDEKREALSYELGDILWALARLVDDLGLDFSKIAENNIAKLEDRKKRNVISGSGDKR